jgi:hypothetical protein
VCKNSEIHLSETKVTARKFVQCLSCKLLKRDILRLHQDLGKVYKSLKSGDLWLQILFFPQGFPQNSGNLILRQCRIGECLSAHKPKSLGRQFSSEKIPAEKFSLATSA